MLAVLSQFGIEPLNFILKAWIKNLELGVLNAWVLTRQRGSDGGQIETHQGKYGKEM